MATCTVDMEVSVYMKLSVREATFLAAALQNPINGKSDLDENVLRAELFEALNYQLHNLPELPIPF